MCLISHVRNIALDDLGQCVEVLDELYRSRVRVPEKDAYVFFRESLNTAIELTELCNFGCYHYFKIWYDYSHLIIKHDYWSFQNPIDLTEE